MIALHFHFSIVLLFDCLVVHVFLFACSRRLLAELDTLRISLAVVYPQITLFQWPRFIRWIYELVLSLVSSREAIYQLLGRVTRLLQLERVFTSSVEFPQLHTKMVRPLPLEKQNIGFSST